MNYWQDLGIEEKVIEILSEIHYVDPTHHFGRPFLTAYQLAIEYARRFPNDASALGYEIGGEGIGRRTSLAQYLARELSRRINSQHISRIEGGFLSNLHLAEIFFESDGESLKSSLTNTQFDLSMYRLRD